MEWIPCGVFAWDSVLVEARPGLFIHILVYIYMCVCIYLLGMHIRWTWLSQIIWVVMQGIRATPFTHQIATKNHKNIFRTVEGMPSCHVLLKSREVCCDWRTTTQTFPAKQLLIQQPEMEQVQMFGSSMCIYHKAKGRQGLGRSFGWWFVHVVFLFLLLKRFPLSALICT